MDLYTLPNVKYIACGKQLHRRVISSVFCDHLEGSDRECGRETQEGGDICICRADSLFYIAETNKAM